MSKQSRLNHQWVRFIPDKPGQGILYLSREYRTATHLCCCGCGLEVVTPLNPSKWAVVDHGDSVSLIPSIGNWSFPCNSHYWIDRNGVEWVEAMTSKQIARVRENDRVAVQLMVETKSPTGGFWRALLRWVGRR